ncbi:MAG: hypothetical protein AAGF11_22680 [Myxococcota bacterium]
MTWRKGRHHFPCYTGLDRNVRGGSVVHAESFTAMVIADLLMGRREDANLVRSIGSMLMRELGREDVFYFFKEHERLPADADCTALGLSVLLRNGARVRDRAHRALDRILANTNEQGVVQTYFDPTGERDGIVDPVVCANVLFLAFQLDRAHEAQPTLDFVRDVLVSERYLEGTRYYHSPDSFLYFLGRVVHHFPEARETLQGPLREAVRRRQGSTDYPIDLAQRVLLSTWLGIDDGGELDRLIDAQGSNGTWAPDALFRYGRKKVFFGSRPLSSAFALAAVTQGTRTVAAPTEVDEDAVTQKIEPAHERFRLVPVDAGPSTGGAVVLTLQSRR